MMSFTSSSDVPLRNEEVREEVPMKGLDDRHRNANGQIEKKHGNTKMKNLKPHYPEFKNFRDEDTLAQVENRYGAESLDDLQRKLRNR